MLTLILLWAQATASPTTTPDLFQAIGQHTSSSAAMALINAGADLTARDSHGRTPLHAAVVAGKQELIQLLLAKGADPNTRDDTGASPLDEAAWGGSVEIARMLVDAGAAVNAPETKTGATPINEAVFKDHIDVIKLLLARGADTSIRDHAGFSPAENAVRRHHPEVLGILLEHERDGALPVRLLADAVRRGQADTVQTLLELGVGVDAKFVSGSTALYEAALKGDDQIVSLLVSRGADVNARETVSGTTPLYAAAAFGRAQTVAALLLWGADPNLFSAEGVSPRRVAESNRFVTIAAQIREAGGR
jgi:uncharacterized protein